MTNTGSILQKLLITIIVYEMKKTENLYLSEKELDKLFEEGLKLYRSGDFFMAHEIWEDMWHNKNFTDRKFIQGLIQLSASFYKIQTGNIRGARSLLEKSKNKFEEYKGIHRNINVDQLKTELNIIGKKYNSIKITKDFSLNEVPELKT
ncbi:DUF309 domain-containing protein [Calditrichota bacterium]